MASETRTAERWLHGVLTGDGALLTQLGGAGRIHGYIAPQGATLPYVVYQFQGGADVVGVGAIRIMANLVYLVRVIGTDSFEQLKAAADRIDAVLQAKSGTVSDGIVYGCSRQQPFSMVEDEGTGGVPIKHLGGLYRLWAQSPAAA